MSRSGVFVRRIIETRIYSSLKMENNPQPTLGHGKICYLEIPAVDIARSAKFYETVLGWKTRTRGDGSVAFDDGVGQVSGTWMKGWKPNTDPAVIIHIMVDDMAGTLQAVVANGGKIVQNVGMHAPEITARFSDPAGNVFGLYQHGGKG
jgi:predicted enzyme related to lactoylglutathione lyase